MDQNKDLTQFNDKTVLVFGGYGFIGSNFIRSLFAGSPTVRIVCVDALTYSGNRFNLEDVRKNNNFNFTETKGDISKAVDVNSAFACNPDYVINFAAETHVDRSIHVGSLEFIKTNVEGVYNILEAAKGSPTLKKYVQVSTDEVYGQLENPHDVLKDAIECGRDGSKCEDRISTKHYHVGGLALSHDQLFDFVNNKKFSRSSPFKPNVPYSATKAAGDCLCNAYNHTWHVPVVVTHCSNNYGPYQYPEKMLPFWASRLIRGEKIPMYGDGMNVRDWIHVDDHVTALCAVLLRGVPGRDYLIGADNERTNLEMAQLIIDYVLRDIKGIHAPNIEEQIEFVTDRPGHDRRYAIDASDTISELGWNPRYGRAEFNAKLKETLNWYAQNKEWVEEVIERTGVANPHIDLWKGHDIKDNEKRSG